MINLMYCGNSKVFDGLLISLLSAIKSTKEKIHAYILTMDLTSIDPKFTPISKKQIDFLENMMKEYNKENQITLLDLTTTFMNEMSSSKNLNTPYTPYTLLRLVADKADLPEKIIYLDTDTVIKSDINELYSIDVSNYEYAAVPDYLGRFFMIYRKFRYINAGVLLLNLKMMKETKLLHKCRKLLNEKKLPFPDQDAINILGKKRLLLKDKFNRQRKAKKDTVIQHFCKGITFKYIIPRTYNIKPWQIEQLHNTLKVHIYDEILDEYKQRIKIFN